MKRLMILVLTCALLLAGSIFLMQRLFAQQILDRQPLNTPKGQVLHEYVVEGDVLNREDVPLQQKDYAFSQQALEILAKYQGTEDSQQREKMRADLQKIVSDQFELRQQIRDKELEQLEAQVRRLRNIHSRRQQERDSIITNRVQQLIRDADGLGWGGDDTTTHGDLGRWPVEHYPETVPVPTKP